VYKRGKDGNGIIVGVYVDDLIITGEDPQAIAIFKQQMMGEFDMSDLGLLTYYLGIEVEQDAGALQLSNQRMLRKY
jgi:hypothetical protein